MWLLDKYIPNLSRSVTSRPSWQFQEALQLRKAGQTSALTGKKIGKLLLKRKESLLNGFLASFAVDIESHSDGKHMFVYLNGADSYTQLLFIALAF